MAKRCFTLGLDFGANSARSLIADIGTGEEIATAVEPFPSGEDGVLLDKKNQAVAPGACMMASAAAGKNAEGHTSVRAAQKHMSGLKQRVFRPVAQNRGVYGQLFALYSEVHDAFGAINRKADLDRVMKTLLDTKERIAK